MNAFKGFGLFNDVEDAQLQAQNRARMLINIFLDHSKNGRVNIKGAALSTGYMNAVPQGQRRLVIEKFIEGMKKEGFDLGGSKAVQERAIQEAVNA